MLEAGKTAGDADTLIFERGRFRSTACDRYGYGDGACTVTHDGDSLHFEAETESPQYGRLRWHGTVTGRRLDGTLVADAARRRLDAAGHHARSDIFTQQINRRPQRPVSEGEA